MALSQASWQIKTKEAYWIRGSGMLGSITGLRGAGLPQQIRLCQNS